MITRFGKRLAACGFVIASTSGLSAQQRDLGSATPLRARVRVPGVSQQGDTITLSYIVDNKSVVGTGEDLWLLLVDTPTPALRVLAPNKAWRTDRTNVGRPAARWAYISDILIRPGHSTPPLRLTAVGVTGIVQFWAVPDLDAHPPVGEGDEPANGPPRDAMKSYGDSGMTVGIVPLPTAANVGDLLARLRQLLAYSCTTAHWMNDEECRQLSEKLDHAAEQLSKGKPEQAADAIDQFAKKLGDNSDEGADKVVSPEAVALLKPNADYLRRRLDRM